MVIILCYFIIIGEARSPECIWRKGKPDVIQRPWFCRRPKSSEEDLGPGVDPGSLAAGEALWGRSQPTWNWESGKRKCIL